MNAPFEIVTGLGFAAFVLLLVAMPLAFWALSSQSRGGGVRLLVAVANLLLTTQLVLRWWQSGHFPISNLYESLCFLAWACTLTQLLVERSWPSPIVAAAVPVPVPVSVEVPPVSDGSVWLVPLVGEMLVPLVAEAAVPVVVEVSAVKVSAGGAGGGLGRASFLNGIGNGRFRGSSSSCAMLAWSPSFP